MSSLFSCIARGRLCYGCRGGVIRSRLYLNLKLKIQVNFIRVGINLLPEASRRQGTSENNEAYWLRLCRTKSV